MILLPRRTFLGLCVATLGATVFLLLAVAAQHGRGPLARFARHRPARRPASAAFCPALAGEQQGAITAYQEIEAALAKGSLAHVSDNAVRIAEAFGEMNPDIAACARRLARLRDVVAARREFQRLTDLFSHRPDAPDADDDSEEDEPPARRTLEV